MDATLSDDGNHISTPNYSYPVSQTAKIVAYEPEKISITAKAAAKLVEKMKGNVTGFAFIIELTELNGMKKIAGYKTVSLVKY